MSHSLAVVCEARADCETACALADRVLCAEVEWITSEVLDDYRQWRGFLRGDPFVNWQSDVPRLARERRIRAHGHFDGNPKAPDEGNARLALLLLYGSPHPPAGVLLMRDDDRETERRQGLEQARKWARERLPALGPVVIGLAHPKRECWALAGFDPRDQEEEKLLASVRQELGFDPRFAAERLTAKHDHDTRSAKRVLDVLTRGVRERQADCWNLASLDILKQRGQQTGLADFLDELRRLLISLFR